MSREALGSDDFYASAFDGPRPAAAPAPVPLSEAEALNVVIRHEACLSHQLRHALHELEALRDRRRGRCPPLARVDVRGLPGT